MSATRALQITGRTHVGLVRKNNEDKLLIDADLGLLIVADGMGGHNAGELASELAATTIWELARDGQSGGDEGSEGSPRARRLRWLVRQANARVCAEGRADPKNHGMGTTVVAALVDATSLIFAHVGDSRLYLYRGGQLVRLTEDHSVVDEQLRKGLISPENAAKSPFANILTRALGSEQADPDVFERELNPDDVLLLATDGLTKMTREEQIAAAIEKEPDLEKLADRLIELALAGGGKDNVTVIIARVASRR